MLPDDPPVARFWERSGGEGRSVRCFLCPNFCVIADGQAGRCRVRVNREGSLYAMAYGVVSSLALDPVEKKPFAHFHPGSYLLSAGSFGCNLGCKFCQNHGIAQVGVPAEGLKGRSFERYTPEELVVAANECRQRGNIGIAYTYNEPFTDFEFVKDTALLARRSGLKNALVTNGYVNPEPLADIMPVIDAMNIDLKAFTESFYRTTCGGALAPVKATIETVVRAYPACHVEITTLVIPGLNSGREEIESLASWLASLSPDLPLHLSRHHPDYLMEKPDPIDVGELFALADIARTHLNFVHCGNI